MSLEMSENLKEIDHLEDLVVDNLIIRQNMDIKQNS